MPVRIRGRAVHAEETGSLLIKKKKTKSFTRHRSGPFSVAKGSCNTRKENMQALCPSVTLKYIFNSPRVLPCLWYATESQPPPSHPLRLMPQLPCYPPATPLPYHFLQYTFQVFKKDKFFLLLIYLLMYTLKKNLVNTPLGTLIESISLLKTSDMVFTCSFLEPSGENIRNLV